MNTSLSEPVRKESATVSIISFVLVFLFVYTAVSKLLVFAEFKNQMFNQAIPAWLAMVLIWSLPAVEIVTSLLLINQKFRLVGLWMSFTLLTIFTGYIFYVLTGLAERQPCSCGGILKSMGWSAHLVFNIFFMLLSAIGIYQFNRERRATGTEQ